MPNGEIFIDCTHTFFFGGTGGIQRVVRSIVRTASRSCGVKSAVPVVFVGGRFIRMENVRFGRCRAFGAIRAFKRKTAPFFERMPGPPEKFLRQIVYIFAFVLINVAYAFRPSAVLGKGDVIFFPDAGWYTDNRFFWRLVDEARRRGARVGFLFYDIIPIRRPDFVPGEFGAHFLGWFRRALGRADFFITDSETVRNDILAYIRESNVPEPPSFFWYPVADFDSPKKYAARRQPRMTRRSKHIEEVFKTGDSIYVFVSTVEIRKNHGYALSAFELLWRDKDFRGVLLIIGRRGWLAEETIDRILAHPEYGKRLFMLHDVSDSDLSFAYEHASGAVFTSFIEGFGLPIIEARSFGLPVFASDIPVHREIGRGSVHYLSLGNPEDLAEKIRTHADDCTVCKSDRSIEVSYSWDESCRRLFAAIEALALR